MQKYKKLISPYLVPKSYRIEMIANLHKIILKTRIQNEKGNQIKSNEKIIALIF